MSLTWRSRRVVGVLGEAGVLGLEPGSFSHAVVSANSEHIFLSLRRLNLLVSGRLNE